MADQIVNHLLDQNKTCSTGSMTNEEYSCRYRSGGLMCAAGCLIGADEYKEEFEYRGWGRLVEKFGVTTKHQRLIGNFQDVHDSCPVAAWEDALKGVLQKHGLEFNRKGAQ